MGKAVVKVGWQNTWKSDLPHNHQLSSCLVYYDELNQKMQMMGRTEQKLMINNSTTGPTTISLQELHERLHLNIVRTFSSNSNIQLKFNTGQYESRINGV